MDKRDVVHNTRSTQYLYRRKTDSQSRVACNEKLVEFARLILATGRMLVDRQADIETDIQIYNTALVRSVTVPAVRRSNDDVVSLR